MSTAPAPGPPSAEEFRAAIDATSSPPEVAAAAVRLGEALRALNQAVVGSAAPDVVLQEVAGEVERLTASLAPHTRPSRYGQDRVASGPGTFINHPMIGPANPCAPRIAMRVEDDHLVGAVTFGTPQEGPPGCGYGGYLAAGFDAILLMTAGINGVGGATRSLAVRYRRPTPLHTPLSYIGHIAALEERVVRVQGALVDEAGTVYVEGEAEAARGVRLSRPDFP